MPTNKKRIARGGRIEISEDQKYHLLKGYTLLSYCEPFFGKMSYPFENERHRRAVWRKCRAELMKQTEPDRRPHGWWCYESKGNRRIVSGNPDFALWDRGLYFGQARVQFYTNAKLARPGQGIKNSCAPWCPSERVAVGK